MTESTLVAAESATMPGVVERIFSYSEFPVESLLAGTLRRE